jgi:xanthine dehydrogenase accessory factor
MADDHRPVYEALVKVQKNGTPAALATVIRTTGSMPRHAGSKMLVYPDGQIVGTIGGGMMESEVIKAAQDAIQQGEARLETYSLNSIDAGDPGICGGSADIFIEPLEVAPTLLVIGGGHVGKALADLGKWLGYRVVLSDDREAFCNPMYAPGLDDYIVCTPDNLTDRIDITPQTYIAAVTRGLPIDEHLIPALLDTDAAYIGLIGSRRRWALTAGHLRDTHGLTNEQLARVRAPIGLELEAESPREIALSILAEITMLRRGGTGQPMQWLGNVSETK